MGGQKVAAIVLLVVGIVVLLISLFAAPVGIGGPSFGPYQIGGAVVGAVLTVIGLILMLRRQSLA